MTHLILIINTPHLIHPAMNSFVVDYITPYKFGHHSHNTVREFFLPVYVLDSAGLKYDDLFNLVCRVTFDAFYTRLSGWHEVITSIQPIKYKCSAIEFCETYKNIEENC